MQTLELQDVPNYAPCIDDDDVRAVALAVRSGWVSYGGPEVAAFERSVAQALGFSGSVGVSSGTCALQLAAELLVKPGEEVLMPALTFAAPASVIVRAGAVPVFIDLDPETWQIDTSLLRRFLERCKRSAGRTINPNTGRVVSSLCIVHLWGSLANLEAIAQLAHEFDLNVIQDAAQCLGARYAGAPFGSFRLTEDAARSIATTSFNANKIVTTGAGGALLCHDEQVLKRAAHIASTAKTNAFSFEHDYPGVNYRLSNVNAALGLAQIARLARRIDAKRAIYEKYIEALAPRGVAFAQSAPHAETNFWACCVKLQQSAEQVIKRMQRERIQARPAWIPLPLLRLYHPYEYVSDAQISETLWRHGLMLPASPSLTAAEQEKTLRALGAALC